MRRPPDALALVMLGLLGASWGLHVALTKLLGAADMVEALAFLVVYIAGTAAGLVAMARANGRPFRPRAATLRFFAISSLLGYVGPILAELIIAPRIDAGAFALIGAAVPVLTVAIGIALGRERLTGRLAAALGAGAGAALLLLGPGAGAAGPAPWIAAAFAVPLFYAADNFFIEAAWPPGLDSLQVAGGEAIVAAGLCLLLAAAFGVGWAEVAAAAARGGWTLAALVCVSLAGVWLYFHLVHRNGAVFVSFASYVAIAAGVGAGMAVFGERPTAALAGAAALLVAALWLLNRDRAAAAAARTAQP